MQAPNRSGTRRKLKSGPLKGTICTPNAAQYPNRKITLTGNLSTTNTLNHIFNTPFGAVRRRNGSPKTAAFVAVSRADFKATPGFSLHILNRRA
jgi:hypothetical protein